MSSRICSSPSAYDYNYYEARETLRRALAESVFFLAQHPAGEHRLRLMRLWSEADREITAAAAK